MCNDVLLLPLELHKANGKLFEKRMQIETLKEAAKNIEKNVTIHWTDTAKLLVTKIFQNLVK